MTWKTGMTIRTVRLCSVLGLPLDGDEQWLVECRCGAFSVVVESKLNEARDRSLLVRRGRVPHLCPRCRASSGGESNGLSRRPEYAAWRNAWHRCHNPKNSDFENYGGRGLVMAPEWHPPTRPGFVRFLAHIGPRPKGMSLERFDNDLGYVPGNVGWTSWGRQVSNRRRLSTQLKDDRGRWAKREG